LIALSGARDGDVGRALLAEKADRAGKRLADWLSLFGDRFYLQLARTGRAGEEDYLHAAVDLAMRRGVPVVATNEVCFVQREDFQAHTIRVCIHQGRTLDDPRRPKNYSPEQYLRRPNEMAELFADIPEALTNTLELAKRCNLELTLGQVFLPDFPIPEDLTVDEQLRLDARHGLEWRMATILDANAADHAQQRDRYFVRLEVELGVIITMGFSGYFLIVADFIQWAKDQGIPVGPGRGSGAGSLVAYALQITDLDPLAHDLLFERFLNPERVSMPDFDIDFCMDNRDRVIDYVARKYGRESVSQIITFGSMAAKAVVRDVGRVLGHPYGFTDRIAKLVPPDIGMTLDKALAENDEFQSAYQTDEEVRELVDMARQLEGLARNPGKHAGGVVIAPGKLTNFTPLYCEPGGENLVTQFDKDDVEQAGLVKFDFLGLRNLTIIDWALKTINAERTHAGQAALDITRIPMDDVASFELLKRGETTAVFQLESDGMKKLIKKLLPDSFDDITALVALFRPGPLQSGMVDDFIARKHGVQKVEYLHPDLAPILEPTYGVILYQEQVMQIAQELAGYTLGGADLLRRAMGKKKPEEMAKQREIFVQGAHARGVEVRTATHIFDLMEKFAGYGFNKSHSAAYALVAYQTLWLKAHYPAAYMAAVLSSDMDSTDKVVIFIEECRHMALEVAPPDVNRSTYRFTANGARTIVYGLGAIKGVGEAAIEAIVEARDRAGPCQNLFEFCRRVELKKVNRRVMESLIRAGAFDRLGTNRATLMAQLPLALRMAEQYHAVQAAGQDDLFGMDAQSADTRALPDLGVLSHDVEDWEDAERLQGEKETLGLFLTGHPIDFYEAELAHLVSARLGTLALEEGSAERGRRGGRKVTVAGLVIAVNRRNTQRGTMASLLVDDKTGRIEATLFNEAFEQYKDLIAVDRLLVLEGGLALDDYRGGVSLRVERCEVLETCRIARAGVLDLTFPADDGGRTPLSGDELVERLAETLAPYRQAGAEVRLTYRFAAAQGVLRFGDTWQVQLADELLRRLRRLLGQENVVVRYGPAREAAFRPRVAL
jgi:DNA polymerase-3 subunit alpha